MAPPNFHFWVDNNAGLYPVSAARLASSVRAFNVLSPAYGATGDGTTNDRAAIQAAADACQAAGGGIVYFPEGTYNLSAGASAITIPSGNVPVIFKGAGVGRTKIKLSNTVPSFLTLNRTADDQTFSDIAVEDLTVDANNCTGLSHIVIGNVGNAQRVNLARIRVSRVRTINVDTYTDADSSTKYHRNVYLACSHSAAAQGANTIQDILIEDCDFSGGNVGAQVIGTGGATVGFTMALDNIVIQRCKHDTGTLPTIYRPDANFHVGSRGLGGRAVIRDCYGANSGDVGIELNSLDRFTVDNCHIENTRIPYFFTNYNNPRTAAAQKITYRNCSYANTSYVGDTATAQIPKGWWGFQNSSIALGTVEIIDCALYSAVGPSTATSGLTGFAIHYQHGARRIYVRNFKLDVAFGTYSGATNVTYIPMVVDTSTSTHVEVDGVDEKWTGVRSGSGVVSHYSFDPRGTVTFNVVGWKQDAAGVTGISANKWFGFDLGVNTSTLKGRFSRCSFGVLSDDSGPRGFIVRGTGLLTIDGFIEIEDCDFRAMTAGTEVLFATSNENKDKVFFRGLKMRSANWPPMGAAITPGASPYTYQNLDGYQELVTVSGGTVSAIDISNDNSTFTVTGLTSGAFVLENAASLKVTYSSTPTMKKNPMGKQ